ncbi:GTP-binding protein [Acinetobacter rongchengensis]|uniref:GTP-binding protein n=1 Tax=Acinetobacter rongchengensis TaxID=2419601 RepID=A0A3A8F8K1_9GAMM|nr:ATP/GTP-binding protein [Acinetobacter rongchengensis]RKG36973.1 GTP-binding protein [Acinetobacter rongchengensis]
MILQKYKIVFGGKMGAGKTAAIKSLSEISVLSTEAHNTDEQSHSKALTTVGIDYGEIKLDDDVVVGLYGTPGQDRFDFVWSVICKGAIGAIVLIDHSQKDAIEDLKFYFETFKEYLNNIVVGVTHVDEDPQHLLKPYKDWMHLNQQTMPIFAIDAREKDDVLLMVEALIARAEVEFG